MASPISSYGPRIEDTVPTGITGSLDGRDLFEQYLPKAAMESGLDPDFIRGVAEHESAGFKPYAHGALDGGYGFMQIIRTTGDGLGIDRRVVQDNIVYGAKLLREEIDRFNDVDLGLVAYFKGPNFAKELAEGKKTWDDPNVLGGTTIKNYVRLVKGKISKHRLETMAKAPAFDETTPVTMAQPVVEEDKYTGPLARIDLPATEKSEPEAPVLPRENMSAPIVEEYAPTPLASADATATAPKEIETRVQTPAMVLGADAPMLSDVSGEIKPIEKLGREMPRVTQINALVEGVRKTLPFVDDRYAQMFAEQDMQGAMLLGQIGANLAAGAVGGIAAKGILQGIPMLSKSPVLLGAAVRALTAGGVTATQQDWTKNFGEALANTVQSAGAGVVSLVPEFAVAANKLQLLAQPLAGVLFEVSADMARNKAQQAWKTPEARDAYIKEKLIGAALDLGMASVDVGTGSLKGEQAAYRADLKNIGNKIEMKALGVKGPLMAMATGTKYKRGSAFQEPGFIKPSVTLTDKKYNSSYYAHNFKEARDGLARINKRFGDAEGWTPESEAAAKVTDEAQYPKLPESPEQPQEVTPTAEPLPIRNRGFASQTGSVGGDASVGGGSKAKAVFDANREEARAALHKSADQIARKAGDFLGSAFVSRGYTARRLLKKGGSSTGLDAARKWQQQKGGQAIVKKRALDAEAEIYENIPHEYEMDFANYHMAKRIVEIVEANPDKNYKSGKVTYEDAKQLVAEVEADPKTFAMFNKAQEAFNAATAKELQDDVDNGIISQEQADYLSEKYSDYTPMQYVSHTDPDGGMAGPMLGKRTSVGDSGIKALDEGSESAFLSNPRYALLQVISRSQSRIAKNRANKALYTHITEGENLTGGKIAETIDRTIPLTTAESIVSNLQGARTRLAQKVANPISADERLRLERDIDDLTSKLDDLDATKVLEDIDNESAIADLQKRILDVSGKARASGEPKETVAADQIIARLNSKIERLSKMPETSKTAADIAATQRRIRDLTYKITDPRSGSEQTMLDDKLAALDEKIAGWGQKIQDANGEDIVLKGKTLKPVENGMERVYVMLDGQRQGIDLPKDFADSWNATGAILPHYLLNTLRVLSGSALVKTFATGAGGPEFSIANTFLDAANQILHSGEYSNFIPVALGQYVRNSVKVFHDAKTGKGRWAEYVENYGGQDFASKEGMWSVDEQKVSPNRERNAELYDKMTTLQTVSERLGRLALDEQARQNGKSPEEAAAISRELLDFGDGGWLIKTLDAIVPYSSAGVQATRGAVRAGRDRPKDTAMRYAQVALMGTGVAMAMDKYNREFRDKLSDRDRIEYWTIPLPAKVKYSNGKESQAYLAIRKDAGSKLASTFGELIYEVGKGITSPVDAARRMKMASEGVNLADVAKMSVPLYSAVKGYKSNTDFWRDEPIWRGSRDVSPSEEYTEGKTPRFFNDAAQVLDKVGIEVSPDRAAYANRTMVPRNIFSAMAGMAYEEVFSSFTKEDRSVIEGQMWKTLGKDIPFARKFIRLTSPSMPTSEEVAEKAMDAGVTVKPGRSLQSTMSDVRKAETKVADYKHRNTQELLKIIKAKRAPDQLYMKLGNDRDEIKRLKKLYRRRTKE